MAVDVNEKAEFIELLRIQQGLLRQWVYWNTPRQVEAYIARRREMIAELEAEIEEARAKQAVASAKVVKCRGACRRIRGVLVEIEHQLEIKKLVDLCQQFAGSSTGDSPDD